MSYFSVTDFIESGEKSLKDKNYWSALSVALMLPSMCSRLEYSDNQDYLKDNGQYKDKKCYIDWCNEHMSNDGWLIMAVGNDYADILYQLRCDIVHAGQAKIYADNKGIYLALNDGPVGEFKDLKILDIKALCQEIFNHAKMWCSEFGANNFRYTYVFNGNDHDDMLLYRRLCDDARSERLLEEFKKEQEDLKKDSEGED